MGDGTSPVPVFICLFGGQYTQLPNSGRDQDPVDRMTASRASRHVPLGRSPRIRELRILSPEFTRTQSRLRTAAAMWRALMP